MFQKRLKENEDVKVYKFEELREIIKEFFSKEKIFLYIISLVISMISFGGNGTLGLAPFALAILVASISNNIQIGIIYVLTLIGTFIGFRMEGLLTYVLTTLVLFVTLFIFKVRVDESSNEKRKLGKHLVISILAVKLIPMIFTTFYLYDFLISIMLSIVTYMFYKIFVNSIPVIRQAGLKKVFSIEEIMGAALLVAISLIALEPITVFGFSVKNILSIFIVLVLGWKSGMLVGATAGITIGAVLGIIGNGQPIMIAAYALSGLLAGIFGKFGKIGGIIGFAVGNTFLTYVVNGNVIPIIYFQEILIASIGLLAVPKKVSIKMEDLLGKTKLLPETTGKTLEENKETISKLNNISETIFEIAKSYSEVAATIVDDDELTKQEQENERIFLLELRDNLEEVEDNILYEDIYNSDEISSDIFKYLLKNDVITEKGLIKIFEDHNSYIVEIKEENKELKNDISKMINVINHSFRISRINFVWKKKINQNNKNVSEQLQGVSEVIADLADSIKINNNKTFDFEKEQIVSLLQQKQIEIKDINLKKQESGRYEVMVVTDPCIKSDGSECEVKRIGQIISKVLKEEMIIQKQNCGLRLNENSCTHMYISNDKFNLQVGIAKTTKNGSAVSGDSSIQTKLEDGKYLLAISDGMGSGEEARKSSKIAIKMLERLLTSGFKKDTSMKLINSILSANIDSDMYATMDVSVLDLYKGNLEFFKNGASPSYVKRNKEVQVLKEISLPSGVISEQDIVVYDKDLKSGDIIVMCTDGVVESNSDFIHKELWIKYLLEEIETSDVQKIADIIISEAIDNDFGKEKDDMTVVVAKIS